MSTILSKESHEIKNHYSLRKLGTGLASVLIGINLFELAPKSEKVKADSISNPAIDQENSDQASNSDHFTVLGKIIPVNQKQQAIANAPTPHYRRDPNDPSKALPTPAPEIEGYQVAKNNQNYDHKTKMVTPPADPSKDTMLVYGEKKPVKEPANRPSQRPAKRPQTSSQQVITNNPTNYSNKQRVDSNSGQTRVVPGTNRDQQVKESVQKTRLFGFGRKKNQTDTAQDNTQQKSDSTTLADTQTSTAQAAEEKAEKIEKKKKQEHQAANKRAKTNSKKSATEKTAKKAEPKKRNKPRKGSQLKATERPQAVMNPETKIPPKPLVATLEIVDQDDDDRELTSLTFEGHENEPIVFNNLKQVVEIHNYDGYQAVALVNQNNGEKIDFHDLDQVDFGSFAKDDVNFVLKMKHKVIKLTPENAGGKIDPKELKFVTTLTVHYRGAGDLTPKDSVEKATWTRNKTYDLVNREIVAGKYDTEWTSDPQAYMSVVSPDIDGYHPDEVETPVLPVRKKNIEKTVTYLAAGVQAQPKKEPEEQPKPKLSIRFVSKSEEKAKKKAKAKEKQALAQEAKERQNQADASDYEKEAALIVNFTGAGEKTPEKVVQKIKWTRSLKITEEGELVNTPWSQAKEYYDDVKVPVINGYHANVKEIKGPLVKQDDLKKTVSYEANGYFIPVDQAGKVIGDKKQFITDPDDASKVLMQEELPVVAGYQAPTKLMNPYNPGKDQRVFYQEQISYLQVDRNHPNELVTANNYLKTVHFTVRFTGAGDANPQAVEQEAKLTRSLTLDNHSRIVENGKYTTEWRPEIDRFEDVKIPAIAGYSTDAKVITGPEVGQEDIEKVVTYQKVQVTQAMPEPAMPTEPAPVTEATEITQVTKATEAKEKAKQTAKPILKPKLKPEITEAPTEVSATGDFVQTIHFVDQAGKQLVEDQKKKLAAKDSKTVQTFANTTVPVVEGYFAETKQVKGKAVMADDKNHAPEITVHYQKLGQIIPINLDGEVITDPADETKTLSRTFANDPADASKAELAQAVPEIEGWQASVKTVSPVDPGINIPVLYNKKD